ncbi:MAG: hypothetical protein ACLGIA_05835 [Actinomycetes bacterium]
MTTIKASCPSCGDVDLTPAQVRLVVCSVESWSYYSFTCGRCQDEVRKPAVRQVVDLLRSGGVHAESWVVPAEALEEHEGPTLTLDDLLDLVLALQRVDVLSAVAAAGARHRRPVA